jgi:transposase
MPRHNRRSVAAFLTGPGPGHGQGALFERPLAERAPHVAALKGLVEPLLGQRLRGLASLEGGYGYDPCSLFLVLLFGYLQGQRSSRRLEESCRFDARYAFLSDGLEPDHATLARFRRRLAPELEGLFLLVCQEAERQGVLERRAMAVDGTKVAAVRSQWRRALAEAEAVDALEEEAHKMVRAGQFLVGYNLQLAADPASGMVVGYAATSRAADQGQMEGVLQAVGRQSGGLPEAAVADKGYDSGRDAQALLSRGVKACLPCAERRVRPGFTVGEDGVARCPAGHVATPLAMRTKGREPRTRFVVRKCQGCPLKEACGVKGGRRDFTVAHGAEAGAREAANAFAAGDEGRRLLRLRGPTIERVFGQFKQNQGFRRLLLRGLSGAGVELGLLALGHNLRRLLQGPTTA